VVDRPGAAPGVPVIFAILAGGAPVQAERLRGRGGPDAESLTPSFFLDTASYGHRALELSLSSYGVRALLYGSDVPVIDSRPTLQAIAGFGDAVRDVIMTKNATALFG
jgi:predicted TIM-barrel fold metal-dependent hydrolase